MKLLYLAGPFTDFSPWEAEQHVRRAESFAREVLRMGVYPVIPHSNTRHYFSQEAPAEFFYRATEELMLRCDGVCLLDGWDKSAGALSEYRIALGRKMPIFYQWHSEAIRSWAEFKLATIEDPNGCLEERRVVNAEGRTPTEVGFKRGGE